MIEIVCCANCRFYEEGTCLNYYTTYEQVESDNYCERHEWVTENE